MSAITINTAPTHVIQNQQIQNEHSVERSYATRETGHDPCGAVLDSVYRQGYDGESELQREYLWAAGF